MMATYDELRGLYHDDGLKTQVLVAANIAAYEVLSGNDDAAPYDQTAGKHDLRVTWAQGVVNGGDDYAEHLMRLVLAANATLTVAQIQGATDAAVLANVKAVVDALAQ